MKTGTRKDALATWARRALKNAAQGLVVMSVLGLASCGEGKKEEGSSAGTEVAKVHSAAAQAYYAENPDFFKFATPADIPGDLNWENGMDLPDFGSPNARKGGTWYTVLQDFPRTFRTAGPDANGSFRPFLLDDVTMSWATRHFNETEAFFPSLASEWAISKETRTVYIRVNPEAKWSDGVPITADDMLYMFYFYQSPHIKAPWYNNWYGTQYVSITKFDDLTFAITLPDARPDMDSRALELSPRPEHFYGDLTEDFVDKYQWTFQPTTGPYTIVPEDVKKGRSIAMRRNKDWWAKDNKFYRNRYNPDTIRLVVIRDAPKRFEAFYKGELDQTGLGLSEYWYDKLPNDDELVEKGYVAKSIFYNDRPRPPYGLYINTARPGLDDLNIRLGIQHASNWQAVVERYFRNDAVRMNNFWEGYGRYSKPDIKARPFDPDLARAFFAKAGYDQVGDDGILRNAAGEKLSFQLSTGYESMKDILTILKEEALKAGLELRLEVLDGSAGWKKVQEKKHELAFTAFSGFNEPFPRFWEMVSGENAYDVPYLEDGSPNPERKLKTQTNNLFSYANPEVDAWITTYRASEDKEEMLDLAYKIEQTIHDQAVFVPGFVIPFYRIGHWRWMKYPEDFNVKVSSYASEYYVHWIDEDVKAETEAAMEEGKTFEPTIEVYDKYKRD